MDDPHKFDLIIKPIVITEQSRKMNMLQRILSLIKVSLRSGYNLLEYNPSLNRLYLQAFNSILNLGIAVTLISGVLHIISDKPDIFLHNMIVAALLSVPKIFLRRRSLWWSGMTFIIIVDSILIFYSMILGPTAGIHNLLIITAVIPLVLGFNVRSILLASVSISSYIYLYLINYENPFPFYLKKSEWNDFYSSLLIITAFIGLIYILQKTHLETLKTLDEERLNSYNSSRLASLADLSGAIAHELNNPLAILVGKMELLKIKVNSKDLSKDQILSELVLIERTIERVCQIVKTMTDLVSSENYQVQFNLVDIIEQSISFTKKLSPGVEINLENLTNSEIPISGNPSQLNQAILNLLANAKDAAIKSKPSWIKITLSKDSNSTVIIRITDSGNGIAPEILNKIMDPFFTTKRSVMSAGLGLPIAKRIIENHHGLLLYDRQHPNTSFLIQLPFASERTLKRVA